jgi:hypothetical protein
MDIMKLIRNFNVVLNVAAKLVGGAWLTVHVFFHQYEPACSLRFSLSEIGAAIRMTRAAIALVRSPLSGPIPSGFPPGQISAIMGHPTCR